ncbi:alpha/beta-tubulin-N-acetyltransferase 9 isoform X6 [Narcine bancroftii]|uniref:alpha/beta-tubulin-N-acetyltransferase 9 isoform X6 n=1 Tax=Narcine bancroftii TaxID=1343680 RepID=UPI003831636F
MRNASPSFRPPGMRLNEDVVLLGQLAALVPYSTRHVPRYHQWMKSEELLKLTASEPLTLEQEYQMQRSWQEDDDKPSFRGKGFGKEVTMLMMYFGVTKLRITKFQAKISLENPISIAMFRNLHFEEVSISDVFQEMTLWLIVDDCRKKWLLEQMNRVKQDSSKFSLLGRGITRSCLESGSSLLDLSPVKRISTQESIW